MMQETPRIKAQVPLPTRGGVAVKEVPEPVSRRTEMLLGSPRIIRMTVLETEGSGWTQVASEPAAAETELSQD